jgi:hypothetical protein
MNDDYISMIRVYKDTIFDWSIRTSNADNIISSVEDSDFEDVLAGGKYFIAWFLFLTRMTIKLI